MSKNRGPRGKAGDRAIDARPPRKTKPDRPVHELRAPITTIGVENSTIDRDAHPAKGAPVLASDMVCRMGICPRPGPLPGTCQTG